MCVQCWERAGRPANWSPEIEKALELTRELYSIHSVGGPLHVVVDDWNLDGEIRPYYDCYTPAELDELYYDGTRIADLDPLAPAVVEVLGRSLRQVCGELAAALNAMTVEERMSVLAYYDGFVQVPIKDES